MKVLRFAVLAVIAFALVFTVGCAARQTVKTDTPDATDTSASADVEDAATAVATAVPVQKYVVKKGDTLWDISSMNKIYTDNFQWPLLFKANRDQIEDPDLIEVDQELIVKKDWNKTEVNDARQKAMDTPPFKPHTAARKTLPLRY
ncbi:MAG: LysM domain/BON superfamily protein [Candidatus Aerophobetes bacterium ADurb.Bin490]|nr:MAG: LysM domain/BON superfamily protein [Candidatus Aerophobetes bacterium ADurb.Bin490]HNZ28875.1 LysM peptidoglycan-binding domain-containing protein [Candidatus Goldiibacteriota bacterium]HPI04260.1 LysM peptidoglycan-binding domain-containing protein [Candidatus Goldiibacteriota bacterium]HPN65188.1 LysM peptidoglycan-binding domain-containing protein [Candidatus Goldiibacteriota bacterium]HRQ43552.1 LysM peptidoglycan-binding domain-containing protein [Candidatus Goldiibacteriota bacte